MVSKFDKLVCMEGSRKLKKNRGGGGGNEGGKNVQGSGLEPEA